jgi:cysteine-rich repeat protein
MNTLISKVQRGFMPLAALVITCVIVAVGALIYSPQNNALASHGSEITDFYFCYDAPLGTDCSVEYGPDYQDVCTSGLWDDHDTDLSGNLIMDVWYAPTVGDRCYDLATNFDSTFCCPVEAEPVCGDGVVEGDEVCDDGNTDDGDYCAGDCSEVTGYCGDSTTQTNEVCDDGAFNNTSSYCNDECNGFVPFDITTCPDNVTNLGGGEYEVSPHNSTPGTPGYGVCDRYNIQNAIDMPDANIVKLAEGTFIFRDSEFDSDIHVNKEGFTLTGETGPGTYPEDLLPDGTIAEKPLAVIQAATPLYFDWGTWTYVGGYYGTFLLGAENITFENLEVKWFYQPLHTAAIRYSPGDAGFVINNNRFIEGGTGSFLTPSNYSTYPNWPNTDEVVKSYFTNNKIVNSGQMLHLVGSEVMVANNYMEAYVGTGLILIPNMGDGGWLNANNNELDGNYFNGMYSIPCIDIKTSFAAQAETVGNKLTNNTFANCIFGVILQDTKASNDYDVTDTLIEDNHFIDYIVFGILTFAWSDQR